MVLEHAEASAPSPAAGEDYGRLTILFVDDDALIAMDSVDMLADLGHDVIEASSGEIALEMLQSET